MRRISPKFKLEFKLASKLGINSLEFFLNWLKPEVASQVKMKKILVVSKRVTDPPSLVVEERIRQNALFRKLIGMHTFSFVVIEKTR